MRSHLYVTLILSLGGGCLADTTPEGTPDAADTSSSTADTGSSATACVPACVHGTCTAGAAGATCVCDPGWAGPACADSPSQTLSVEVRALAAEGVGDAVWDLMVFNRSERRWRLTSSAYGDGQGGVAYVVPCVPDELGMVQLWLVGTFTSPVSVAAAGDFGEAVNAAGLTSTEHLNPTWTDGDGDGRRGASDRLWPLEVAFTCEAGSDTLVDVDVLLTEPASHGFFDIALDIDGLLCVAKLDCCQDVDGDGACSNGELIRVLDRPDGSAGRSIILALVCAAPEVGTNPVLLFDDVLIDCTHPDGSSYPPHPDLVVHPVGAGEQCETSDGVTRCANVEDPGGVGIQSYLFQTGVFAGVEHLTTNMAGASVPKLYWNLALGVTDAIDGCRLTARATATGGGSIPPTVDGVLPAGLVYPYFEWNAVVGACASETIWDSRPQDPMQLRFQHPVSPGLSFSNMMLGDGVPIPVAPR